METNIYKKLFEVKKAGIKLQRDTKAFNYKYATLSQIQDKLWDVLQEQWLLIIHYVLDNKVKTEIIDIEWDKNPVQIIFSEIEMTPWLKAQDKGSEITYYRRYNLLSLLDLEVEDDDGKKAQGSKKETSEEDNKPWYNDFDKHTEFFEKQLKEWKTSQDIISKLCEKYKVNKKIRQSIKDLETDNK